MVCTDPLERDRLLGLLVPRVTRVHSYSFAWLPNGHLVHRAALDEDHGRTAWVSAQPKCSTRLSRRHRVDVRDHRASRPKRGAVPSRVGDHQKDRIDARVAHLEGNTAELSLRVV